MNALVNVDAVILLMNMFVQIVNWVFVNQNRFGNDLAKLLLANFPNNKINTR